MTAKNEITPEAARLRMADLCSRSEQCEADIRQKLYRLGLQARQVQEIVEYLIEHKFIDNARFARSFARDKCRFSAWGRNKIRVALIAKRISSPLISQALDSIDEADYVSALKRIAEAKAKTLDLKGSDAYENRVKLFRHIIARGFESDLASKAVKSLL